MSANQCERLSIVTSLVTFLADAYPLVLVLVDLIPRTSLDEYLPFLDLAQNIKTVSMGGRLLATGFALWDPDGWETIIWSLRNMFSRNDGERPGFHVWGTRQDRGSGSIRTGPATGIATEQLLQTRRLPDD